jgi:predicted RNA-binding Zn ribbon-like protein
MTDPKRTAGNLKPLGGRLCLDFVNTLDWRGTETPVEFLNTYPDLVVWSQHVGICTPAETRQLTKLANSQKEEARQACNRAVELRETIYRIFSTISRNRKPASRDLSDFNKYLSESMRASQIVRAKDGYSWETTGNKTRLGWVLNPVIRSAADLLVSDDIKNIKACADPACGWLFLDSSRNKRRRWCDMQDCGNRAKASRFYKKKQGRSA